MVECFETIDEAKKRVKNAPKQQKRSHIPSTVDGNLEQQMLDVNDWKTVNWSEKAKEYQIRRKEQVFLHPMLSKSWRST